MILETVNGIVIVDKEKGYTSHDVVNVIRKIFNTRKVGHTGTLDPDATGVLPICIGKGTKVCDMLTFSDKEYVARVRLGIQTDTQDISGEVIRESEVNVTFDELKCISEKFKGEIMQIPPMYSAIKIGGKKLCDLARKGIEVERKPRPVTVYSIDISNFDGKEFDMKVACSKGTYIRTLCHDIGNALGCGAVMTELRRTKASVFSIDNSHTLESLKQRKENGTLNEVLSPVDSVFSHMPELEISDGIKKRITNGAPSYIGAPLGTYRIYDMNKTFLCIGEVIKDNEKNKNVLRLVKAFF